MHYTNRLLLLVLLVLSPVGVKDQNGVDVEAISNLAIGFPIFWN